MRLSNKILLALLLVFSMQASSGTLFGKSCTDFYFQAKTLSVPITEYQKLMAIGINAGVSPTDMYNSLEGLAKAAHMSDIGFNHQFVYTAKVFKFKVHRIGAQDGDIKAPIDIIRMLQDIKYSFDKLPGRDQSKLRAIISMGMAPDMYRYFMISNEEKKKIIDTITSSLASENDIKKCVRQESMGGLIN